MFRNSLYHFRWSCWCFSPYMFPVEPSRETQSPSLYLLPKLSIKHFFLRLFLFHYIQQHSIYPCLLQQQQHEKSFHPLLSKFLSSMHPFNVFRGCFNTNKNYLFLTLIISFSGFVCCKIYLPVAAPGDAGKPCNRFCCF